MSLGVAMLSRWHVHAQEYANAVEKNPNAQINAIWDDDQHRGQKWAVEMGVPFERNLDSLLSRKDIDAVVVVTATNLHRDVMVAAANAKKHIFTEKVLTTTLTEAREVEAAVETNDVKFAISFPRRTNPHVLYCKSSIDKGLIGKPTAMRIRIAHAGASRNWLPDHFYDPVACGGGAMMDLGAHGMYLCRWFAGKPKRILSVFNNITDGKQVEDNAISMIEFENGVIATNETSFVAYPDSYSIEIDGTEGGLRMLSPRNGVEIRSDHLSTKGWHRPIELPNARPLPIEQWIDACLYGGESEFGIQDAVELTELMEAAYTSQRELRSVAL